MVEPSHGEASTIETVNLDSVANLAGLDLDGLIGTLDDPLNHGAIVLVPHQNAILLGVGTGGPVPVGIGWGGAEAVDPCRH